MNVDITPEEYAELRVEFRRLIESRLSIGQEEYGNLTFLKNDVFAMAYEELADMVNYATFIYVKLRIMERRVNAVRANSADGDAGGHT